MAKTISELKQELKAAQEEIKALAERLPVNKVDTTDLKLLLIDLENLVQGPGTVSDRQKVVDKLKEIINKYEAPE